MIEIVLYGEIIRDVGNSFREAKKNFMKEWIEYNHRENLDELCTDLTIYFVPIILPEVMIEDFPNILNVNDKKSEVEFRVSINYDEFKGSTPHERVALFMAVLIDLSNWLTNQFPKDAKISNAAELLKMAMSREPLVRGVDTA